MVTIKQIAELCGVSRGTVDRVLNGRGKVKAEKAALVRAMAEKLNYRPNPAGKALSARKKQPVVGVLIASEGVHFFDEVLDAMHHHAQKYAEFGLQVLWRSTRGFDAAEQCRILDELMPKVNALIVSPLSERRVLEKLNACVHAGIFVVTINNDAPASKRHCYVGPSYLQGGRTAGALLKMIGPPAIRAGVLLGSLEMYGHRQRLAGFLDVLEKEPGFRYLGVQETNDDDMIAYEETARLLDEHPEANALFVASSGAYGASRALLARERTDLTVVVFDTIPTTIDMMKRGVIRAAIYQHPRTQGHRAMQVVFDYLVNGIAPEHEKYIMRNEIRILENVTECDD